MDLCDMWYCNNRILNFKMLIWLAMVRKLIFFYLLFLVLQLISFKHLILIINILFFWVQFIVYLFNQKNERNIIFLKLRLFMTKKMGGIVQLNSILLN